MAAGSGIAAQLGIKAESVFGTYAAPDRFLIGWLKGNPQFKPNRVQGGGLYAGEAMPRADRFLETTRQGSGTVTIEVSRKQFGIILAHLLGSSTSPVQQGATIAYLQTHTVAADQAGKYLTIQAGVPQTDGTVKAYTFLGCKIQKATFSCGVDETLTADLEFDCRDMTEAQTLAAASFTAGASTAPFTFKDMNVKVGTFASETVVQGVRKVTFTIERPLKTDRQYAGNAGLKSEPLTNGAVVASGTLDTDYVDKTVFVDKFVANTQTSMVLEWQVESPVIVASNKYALRFKLPGTFFTGDTPVVDGPEVVGVPVPFECKLDATNGGLIAEYMSVDTAV